MARFITFEGIDGAGKSTHLAWFRERLADALALRARAAREDAREDIRDADRAFMYEVNEAVDAARPASPVLRETRAVYRPSAERARPPGIVTTREPGGTPMGEALREILLHQRMDLETEALLMFAARREHLAQVIEPALARGDWVLCDRFTDATFAYQGGGRGLPRARLEALEHWVQRGLQPDLTILFDLAPDTASQRRSAARDPDRFERETHAFFARVRAEYLRRAREAPQRFAVVDAAGSIGQIRQRLETILAGLFSASLVPHFSPVA